MARLSIPTRRGALSVGRESIPSGESPRVVFARMRGERRPSSPLSSLSAPPLLARLETGEQRFSHPPSSRPWCPDLTDL